MPEIQDKTAHRRAARAAERTLSFKPLNLASPTNALHPKLLVFKADPAVQDGVSITSYGQGQVSGAIYTIPAHGEVAIDITIRMSCVTPENVINLNNMIKGLLDASHYHRFEEVQQTHISGGLGFFGFWSGGVSASYDDVKHTLDGWGLSEANQQTIVNKMMEIANSFNVLSFKGTIYNRNSDYDVTGSVFGIVMDATVQQGQNHNQLRFLAPKPHLRTDEGENLPIVGNLYNVP